jgi:hypothetical protein
MLDTPRYRLLREQRGLAHSCSARTVIQLKRKLIFGGIALLLLIPVVIIVIFFATEGMFSCDRERLVASRSPDARVVATAYLVECGATTPSATHLELIAVGEGPEENSRILVVEGAVDLELEWISPSQLRVLNVSNPVARDDTYIQEFSWRNVTVQYEGLPTTE